MPPNDGRTAFDDQPDVVTPFRPGSQRRSMPLTADPEPVVKPEPPRPLMRELPPADPFPVDVLGVVLGAAARAIHDRVQAPLAIGAQSVLGAATLAVQAHADV